MDSIGMVLDSYVGPVHPDVIVGMPWVTLCKVRMRSQPGAIDICAWRADELVHLLVPPLAVISSKVRAVESAPQDNDGDDSNAAQDRCFELQ